MMVLVVLIGRFGRLNPEYLAQVIVSMFSGRTSPCVCCMQGKKARQRARGTEAQRGKKKRGA